MNVNYSLLENKPVCAGEEGSWGSVLAGNRVSKESGPGEGQVLTVCLGPEDLAQREAANARRPCTARAARRRQGWFQPLKQALTGKPPPQTQTSSVIS